MTAKKSILVVGIVALALLQTGCFCFFFKGWKWSQTPTSVTYILHSTIPVSWEPLIQQASDKWRLATTDGIVFQNGLPGGRFTSGGDYIRDDNTNMVFRIDFIRRFPDDPRAPGTLAGVLPWVQSCIINQADFGFSVDFLPGHFLNRGFHPDEPLTAPPPGCPKNPPYPSHCRQIFDLETVALHEFGHFLHLAHVRFPRSAVMFRSIKPAQVKRNLHGCDAAGARCIYRSTRCRACRAIIAFLPCPFVMVSENNPISTMQRFRDEHMLLTSNGTAYVQDFNKHLTEVGEEVLLNSVLRDKTSSAITDFNPFLAAYMDQTTLRYTVFSSTRYNQAVDIINLIKQDASPELASSLENFRLDLLAQVGKTYQEAIDTLLGIAPPPPPPPEPPPDCCSEPPPDDGGDLPDLPIAALTPEDFDEIDVILGIDDALQQRVDAFIEPRVSLIQDWVNGGTQSAQVMLTTEEYNELAGIIDQMKLQASPDLTTNLDRVKSYLQGRIDYSYEQILDESTGFVAQ